MDIQWHLFQRTSGLVMRICYTVGRLTCSRAVARAAKALDSQLSELREELQRTRRERDILKRALAIFSQEE
jgi:transposase-like protein